MLVSRLYDASKGVVSVGGVDVRQYDLTALRNAVSPPAMSPIIHPGDMPKVGGISLASSTPRRPLVLQNTVLFPGTILDNLRWGKEDATLEECQRACRLAQADEFIDRMPEGYLTHIEQNGANVSGGQKQRLCIARALLKEPKVLILDDSTSACDTATDAKIRKAFREELPDVTKLIIAQRIQSVQDADRIVVMQSGRVVGFDTHERLLQTCSIYQEIYQLQTQASGDFDAKR